MDPLPSDSSMLNLNHIRQDEAEKSTEIQIMIAMSRENRCNRDKLYSNSLELDIWYF
jgi:hypothetical protein